jgi:YegS/Rv2252/BmrU family lipid kinase
MRYKIIVNPLAGRGFAGRSIPKIEALLAAQGLDFDLVTTRQAGEAIELARQAVLDGYGTVVAAGGDGTYQEVINGMLSADHAADDGVVGNLGVLSLGSGCDFAWAVDAPTALDEACARLARQETKVVDVGRLTVDGETRYFDNTVGIGFEGTVTLEVRKIKYLRGIALYLPAVLKSIFVTMQPARSVIEFERNGETRRLEGAYLLVSVCNGSRAGGAFMIAPQAEPDDGLFDVCFVEDVPRTRMLALVPHFIKGTHVEQPDVAMIRTRRISIVSQDDLSGHADGELVCTQARHVECEVVPKKVRVVC